LPEPGASKSDQSRGTVEELFASERSVVKGTRLAELRFIGLGNGERCEEAYSGMRCSHTGMRSFHIGRDCIFRPGEARVV